IPGTYRVEAQAPRFAKSVANGVILSVGQLAVYDIRLTISSEATAVEVDVHEPMVQLDQTQQANIINEVQVENLPNVNRNFVQSIYTLPGVSNSYAPTEQNPGVGTAYLSSGFSIGASNGRSNLVTIDGGENDYGSGTMRDMHVPIDSIEEFQVNRNGFAAEFGFTSGTAINMVTRGGTNLLHGSAGFYFHDRTLDGGNYFDKLASHGSKPFEQSVIAAASLGGPIHRNRLFFFTAPEFQMLDAATVQNIAAQREFQPVASQANGYNGTCPNQNTPQQQVTQLCYLTQMANAGGAAGAVGDALLNSSMFGDPFASPILTALVAPNDGTFDGIPASPTGSGVRGLPGFSTPRGRYFNWVSRFDYSRPNNSVELRFALMRESDSVSPRPPYSGNEFQTDYTLTGSWTKHILNANMYNTLRVQAVPSNTATVQAPAPNGSEIDLGNEIHLGTPFSYPYIARSRRFQFDDTLAWIKGSHSFSAGGSWRPDNYNVQEKLWFGGEWEFTDGTFSILDLSGAYAQQVADFNVSEGYPAGGPASTNLSAVQAYLAGTPTLLLQADPDSNPKWSGWTNLLGVFAQDTWKMRPRLTVDYGVRLDYDGEPAPVPHSVRVSPRLGIAWVPGKDEKTAVRAAAGMFVAPDIFLIPFYANILGTSGRYVNQDAVVAGLPSPPFPSIFAVWAAQQSNATVAEPNPSFTSAQLASLGVQIGPPGPTAFGNFIYTMAHGFQPAYSIQASFSVARQVTPKLSIEGAYLMYHNLHVEQVLEANFVEDTAVPVDSFVGPYYVPKAGTTAGEPNSSIFQNNAFTSVGSGIYHGATISVTRRMDRGLQLQANYTFSKAIDDTSDFSSLSTPFRPGSLSRDRSLSDFDITHTFVGNAVYTTPFRQANGGVTQRVFSNITVSPIFTARSGIPFTALVPGLVNGTIGHNNNARPWHEGRNQGKGADFYGWDLRLSKTLTSDEGRRSLQIIAQAQNLVNHTNFAAVNNNFPANPDYPLPGGGTIENGPYHLTGFRPTSQVQLSDPLAFMSSYPARQISLALQLSF
ncbi:MAG TPA: TonB-dependent receptor, partial [Terracidiphilus sp.]